MMSADGKVTDDEREVLKGALRNLSGDTRPLASHIEAMLDAGREARRRAGARRAPAATSSRTCTRTPRAPRSPSSWPPPSRSPTTPSPTRRTRRSTRSPRGSGIDEARANELLDSVEADLADRPAVNGVEHRHRWWIRRRRPPARGASPSDESLPVRIGGYRVLRRLATGGTSDVLLARAEGPHGFERVVVLKLLLQQYRDDETFERMFAREAAAYARLSHPAIVKLYDFFSDDGPARHGARVRRRPAARTSCARSSSRRGSVSTTAPRIFVAWRIFGALSAAHTREGPADGRVLARHPPRREPVERPHPVGRSREDRRLRDREGRGRRQREDAGGLHQGHVRVHGARAGARRGGDGPRRRLRGDACCSGSSSRGARPSCGASTSDLEVLRAMAEPTFPSLSALRPDLPVAVLDAVALGLEPDPDRAVDPGRGAGERAARRGGSRRGTAAARGRAPRRTTAVDRARTWRPRCRVRPSFVPPIRRRTPRSPIRSLFAACRPRPTTTLVDRRIRRGATGRASRTSRRCAARGPATGSSRRDAPHGRFASHAR